MIVLGFDTATPATAVGLMLTQGHLLEARHDPRPGERPGHSTQLLGLARELLAQAGLAWGQVERIAVGLGPGTFTGLRIGVATARGLAHSLGVELAGVSSLQALAHGVPAEQAPGVLPVIDARRGEAFAAAYRGDHQLVSPRAVSPQRLGEVLALAQAHGRPSGWLAVGDGAIRFADILLDLGLTLPPAQSPLHRVTGAAICQLGAHAGAHGMQVLPHYGRAPDAEIALQGTGL